MDAVVYCLDIIRSSGVGRCCAPSVNLRYSSERVLAPRYRHLSDLRLYYAVESCAVNVTDFPP